MRKNKIIPILFLITFIFISCDKEENPVTPKNTEILNDLVSKIENHQYGGQVHSLIIEKNDTVIFEKYFNGYTRETKHPLYSVTKSVISALMGICLQQGYIDSINTRVLKFFPEYNGNIANYNSSKEDITIKHLLTMTAGFSWDEGTTSYSDPNNGIAKLIESNDWVKFILDLPMSNIPGTYVTYNSGVSHVLSGIISKATGKSTKDFANDNLFTYLGIQDWTWNNSPDGVTIGGWGLSLRPIDMIKFGRLYLKKGRWNNVQVIPESWIDESTSPHFPINRWCDYGYQWRRYGQQMVSAGLLKSTDIYFASGRGEQFIWVIPEHNAVAVCTAWNDGQSILEPVLWEYILKTLDTIR
jgi:CubicO group peptidase (beta-lactamase class C family)